MKDKYNERQIPDGSVLKKIRFKNIKDYQRRC
jgi:hypothetical protein